MLISAHRLGAFALLGVASSVACGQVFDFTLDTDASGVTGSLGVTASASGSLVGQFDPDTNPSGTRTRVTGNPFALPGATQNDPVPTSVGLPLTLDLDTATSGGFGVSIAGTDATLSGLTLDLLAGGPANADITADLSFSSFTTANPSFFYPAVPLSLPLGSASVDQLIATQTGGPVLGSAMLVSPGVFDVVFAVPVEVSGSASFQGQSVPIDAVPGVLPVTGQLVNGPGGPTFAGAFDVAFMDTLTLDAALPEAPISLPTLFGTTADVNLSLALDGLGFDVDLSGAFNADGFVVPAPGSGVALLGVLAFARRRRG